MPERVIGVVSDTHVPDRANALHPDLLAGLRAAGVVHILHAGDICVPAVLDELAQIAPVTAVRGNRDLFFRKQLSLVQHLELEDIKIGLMHGHGGWVNYLRDKLEYIKMGYRLGRYEPKLFAAAPEAQVIVFGHTHYSELLWKEGKLLFNPGSASVGIPWINVKPSFGLLWMDPESHTARGEIVFLQGYRLEGRQWVPDSRTES